MRSASYEYRVCSSCVASRLLVDDIWEAEYSLYPANSKMHERVGASDYIEELDSACHGCHRVSRRQVKVLAIFLEKLGIRI